MHKIVLLLFLFGTAIIAGISFGYAIDDRQMLWKCVRNEVIGVFLAFLTGIITAAFTIIGIKEQQLTFEMQSRGEPLSLLAGAIVAVPSGNEA